MIKFIYDEIEKKIQKNVEIFKIKGDLSVISLISEASFTVSECDVSLKFMDKSIMGQPEDQPPNQFIFMTVKWKAMIVEISWSHKCSFMIIHSFPNALNLILLRKLEARDLLLDYYQCINTTCKILTELVLG